MTLSLHLMRNKIAFPIEAPGALLAGWVCYGRCTIIMLRQISPMLLPQCSTALAWSSRPPRLRRPTHRPMNPSMPHRLATVWLPSGAWVDWHGETTYPTRWPASARAELQPGGRGSVFTRRRDDSTQDDGVRDLGGARSVDVAALSGRAAARPPAAGVVLTLDT